ncbi:MAG: pilin [Patescibacteria group bacterium]|jgi:hypothetical protein
MLRFKNYCKKVWSWATLGILLAAPAVAYTPLSSDLPLGKGKLPFTVVGGLLNAVVGLVGSAAFIMVVYGGITWLMAGGNEEKVGQAKKVIIWAVLGLIIIFSAYVIVSFVLSNITAATLTTSTTAT